MRPQHPQIASFVLALFLSISTASASPLRSYYLGMHLSFTEGQNHLMRTIREGGYLNPKHYHVS